MFQDHNEPTAPYGDANVPYQQTAQGQMPSPYTGTDGNEANLQTSPYSQPTQGQTPPYVPVPPTPSRRGLRPWPAVIVTLLLAIILGGILFGAGWEFGRGTAVVNGPNTGTLQPGTNPPATVPALSSNNLQAVREAVIAKVRPSVVQVNVTTQSGAGLGSGVIIDKRGYIVTNNHVVNGAQRLEVVLFDGTRMPAQLVGTDPADDLAVVKITPPTSNIVVATLGDSSKLRVGQDVLAIGNPLGITQTVTNGIISALNRSVSEGQGAPTIPDAIQTDAPINPGNSGGALVDLQGNLVGIPTLAAIDPEFNTPASGVGFAIPSNRVNFIVPQIIQTGKVTHTGRAILGVQATTVDPTIAAQGKLSVDHGVLIVSVISNGPAAQAHLQGGDVIVKIDEQTVNDQSALSDVLRSKNPGDTVAVHVYRGSQQLTINVKLGELQAGP